MKNEAFLKINDIPLMGSEPPFIFDSCNEISSTIAKIGLKSLECKFQDGAINEVGVNGVQWNILIEISLEILKKLNTNCPCRENAITITKLEEAMMWQKKRTEDREKRGVEGLNKK